jgi:GAF domain-containing protein
VPASLRHAVLACADSLGAAGAALSVAPGGTRGEPLLASGAIAEELEELQFALGEGPCVDAAAGRSPVLVPDLAGPGAGSRWPAFAPATAEHGIRAMFALPVTSGAALIGVLGVYRAQPGSLPPRELADALVFADAVLVLALDQHAGIAAGRGSLLDIALATRRAQVHQATGMVAAQLNVPMTGALAALRAYAYARGLRLDEVAADVVARRVRLRGGDTPAGHAAPGTAPLGATSADDADPPAPPSGSAADQGEHCANSRSQEGTVGDDRPTSPQVRPDGRRGQG